RDVRAYRWITVDSGRRRLVVTAARADGGEVLARLDEAEGSPTSGISTPARPPFVEAGISIAPSPWRPPQCERSREAGARRASVSLYGPDGIFHGPAFQVVQSLDSVAETRATATLRSRPASELLSSRQADHLVLDPALLDGPGQVVAFWLAKRSSE